MVAAPPPAPRRVITHTKPDGNAAVWIDQPVEMKGPEDKGRAGLVWMTNEHVPDLQTGIDGVTLDKPGIVQPTGSALVYVDIAPNSSSPMHYTESIDYAVVLSGETILELTDGTRTALHAGDSIVQMGTAHAWHNVQDEWSRLLFVNLPAKPTLIDGKPIAGLRLD